MKPNGLVKVVVGAELQAQDLSDLLPARRQHDHGHGIAVGPEVLEDVQSRDLGEA
jgi:hypothetical protein